MNADAERPVFRGDAGGASEGGRVAGVTLPSAISLFIVSPGSGSDSAAFGDSAGTMSATGRPRRVTRTLSPRSTRLMTLLSFALNSPIPISRTLPLNQASGR
jgi:hypothetical protein